MEYLLYQLSLFITGIINLVMAGMLYRGNKHYKRFAIYYRTRLLTTLWIVAFGLGYIIHGLFMWRNTWPTAASALTVSYFHLGAICFNWGYTPLLNPNYLTRRVVWSHGLFFLVGLIIYWTVAALWKQAPMFTMVSFFWFFSYAAWIIFVFYRTYNKVSIRLLRLSFGNVMDFVRWLQVCCDLIVLFGISGVAVTAIFPNDIIPYIFMLVSGIGMFAFIAYSVNKYGSTIDVTTEATHNIASTIPQ